MTKLSTHISVSLAALIVAGFLAVFFAVDWLIKDNLRDELVQGLKTQCRLVDGILPPNSDSLQTLIEQAARDAGVRITVIDDTGRVTADSDPITRHKPLENHLNREEVQMALRSLDGFGFAVRYSASVGRDLIYAAYKSPHRGFIRIARDAAFLENLVWHVRFVFGLIAVVSLVFLVFFTQYLAKRITRPLGALVEAAGEIKRGNYNLTIPAATGDEIGELAARFNEMAAQVRSDIEKLKLVQEIRKDFVANASHELRTPVSSIRGYVETLLDGAMEDGQVSRRFLERALSNVIRLETIVNDMLDLSRLESRDRGLSLRYFDVAAIIRNVLAEFDDAAVRKQLTLVLESSLPAGYSLMADPYQFEKALINLVENAIKYTDAGHVKVRAFEDHDDFVMSVEDTGTGIRAEDIPRIFERFYRVDKGRSRQLGGSGLGLSIVKHIMEIHHGQVSVASEVGRGTTFTLRFPAKATIGISK